MGKRNKRLSLLPDDSQSLSKIPKMENGNLVNTTHSCLGFSKNQIDSLSHTLNKLHKPHIAMLADKYEIPVNNKNTKLDLIHKILSIIENPLRFGEYSALENNINILQNRLTDITKVLGNPKNINIILPKIIDIEVEPSYTEHDVQYDSQNFSDLSTAFIESKFSSIIQQKLPDWKCITPVSQIYIEPPLLENTKFLKFAFKLDISFPSNIDISSWYETHGDSNSSRHQRLVLVSSRLSQFHDIFYPLVIKSPLYLALLQDDTQKMALYSTNTDPQEQQEIIIQYRKEKSHRYVFQMFLISVLGVQEHIDHISSKNHLSSLHAIDTINSSLSQKDELSTTRLPLSLLCPLSRTRIKIPSKGRSCKHIDCFDLYSFLSILHNGNPVSKPQTLCPICTNPISPYRQELFVDEFVQQIIKQVPTDISSVILERDGYWYFNSNPETDSKKITVDLTYIQDDQPDSFDWSTVKVKKESNVSTFQVISLDSSSETSEYNEYDYYYDDQLYPGFLYALGLMTQLDNYDGRPLSQYNSAEYSKVNENVSGSSIADAIIID